MKKLLTAVFVFINALSHAQIINDYFQKIRNNEAELTAFISQMPKGGDLHNHYSGALYAETYFNWAVENNFWINTQTLAVSVNEPKNNSAKEWTQFSELAKNGQLNLYRENLLQLWSMNGYD